DNDDNDADWSTVYPNALVTVKTGADNAPYLQLDEKTTLLPTNLKTGLFDGKQVRALANISITDQAAGDYTKAVYVNWIDSIRTKTTIPSLPDGDNTDYGNDPVEIIKDWVTIVEDGYITLRFRTIWGNTIIPHHVNLITGTNPDNPYEVELRHNANGDLTGETRDALIAFSLDALPDTKGETVKLNLKWTSFTGPKSVKFDYCTDKSSGKITLPTERIVTSVE
ncbi:MAG: NigD-like protein, partial [Duncaniella sp.]|nr:NigD-like protein [Duncaniella sp.]